MWCGVEVAIWRCSGRGKASVLGIIVGCVYFERKGVPLQWHCSRFRRKVMAALPAFLSLDMSLCPIFSPVCSSCSMYGMSPWHVTSYSSCLSGFLRNWKKGTSRTSWSTTSATSCASTLSPTSILTSHTAPMRSTSREPCRGWCEWPSEHTKTDVLIISLVDLIQHDCSDTLNQGVCSSFTPHLFLLPSCVSSVDPLS